MSFDKYLNSARMQGKVKDLMTPGLAVEFIQPWYTPLSTTPATTGIAVGGIGSTFTVTPAGTTPVMNSVPGVQVRADRPEDIRLNDFYFRESVISPKSTLEIRNFAEFGRQLAFYPLKNSKGEKILTAASQKAAEAELDAVLKDKAFYAANKDAFIRWHVEFSDRTQALLNAGDKSPALNRFVLIDFFDGIVGERAERKGALTAAWGTQTKFLGEDGYDPSQMLYAAKYPVSRTEFVNPKGVRIRRYQHSYVLPGEERISSLPVSSTRYEIENPTKDTREVTIVQMQDCLCGYQVTKDRQGVQDSSFVIVPVARFPKGVEFNRELNDGRKLRGIEFYNRDILAESDFDGCMGFSVAWNPKDNVTVSTKPIFYRDDSAAVLKGALESGRISKRFVKNVYSGRETIAGAIAVTVTLKPKAKVSFVCSTALDFPHIRMNGIQSEKKYAALFPEPYGRVEALIEEVLNSEKTVLPRLTADYDALVPEKALSKIYTAKDVRAKDDFKSLAINTLSFLAEATVWDKEDRFLVRECADYPFFNSLDVYFYGSFSLLALQPRLDGAVMRRFANAILSVDEKRRRHHEYVNHPFADLPDPKLEGPRAMRGAVIHDLGSPFDARPDAYDWHNVKEWKDLAPKFVLMVLRHYAQTHDISVLADCREAVYSCIGYLENMVAEGQNFPLTHGTDDTFDNLSSHGISVYCGSLWIAGLRAAAKIAEILNDRERARVWNERADASALEFESALWDAKEGYFHFFVTPVETKDLVPAKLPELAEAVKDSLELTGGTVDFVRDINAWLNDCSIPDEAGDLSRKELREFKKEWITAQCPQAFAPSWTAKIHLDDDDVFADTMLADTYLHLLGLTPITDNAKARRTLEKIYETNYKANSPLIGAANLVHKDGSPLDEFNFQAHDVWIGIQYSIASAMILHGMNDEATDLIESMEKNLYGEARVPFAAPEGFNGSCRLHPEAIEAKFGISKAAAEKLHKALLAKGALLADSRISPTLQHDFAAFNRVYGALAKANKIDAEALFTLLHSTALKYTAGKYFRPGMVFAILEAAKLA